MVPIAAVTLVMESATSVAAAPATSSAPAALRRPIASSRSAVASSNASPIGYANRAWLANAQASTPMGLTEVTQMSNNSTAVAMRASSTPVGASPAVSERPNRMSAPTAARKLTRYSRFAAVSSSAASPPTTGRE